MIGIMTSLVISQKQICKKQYRQPGFARDLSDIELKRGSNGAENFMTTDRHSEGFQ